MGWKPPKPKKLHNPRVTWEFNPASRVHSESGYTRNKRRAIEEALEEMETDDLFTPKYTEKQLNIKKACKELKRTYCGMSDFIDAIEAEDCVIIKTKNLNIKNWIPSKWGSVSVRFEYEANTNNTD